MSTILKLRIGADNETGISIYCSDDAALFGTYAIRIFPVGEILIYTGVRSDGVPLLPGEEGMVVLYLWHFGIALSAVL